jgi:hypothetical protein
VSARVLVAAFCLLVTGCTSAPAGQPAGSSDAPSSPPAEGRWQPTAGATWQWQLTGGLDLDLHTDVIDVDLDVGRSVVEYFHDRGTKVVCYISVGSFERWREDADAFPERVLGDPYEGWSGERWLDIRRIDLLAPIMEGRLDTCAEKGFDGVEPDNMQIHDNETGFPLTYRDQLRYARWLADEAHERGLAIGQKNAPDMTVDLVDLYDFAITEDAFDQGWAARMHPYIEAGKPVFAAEYTETRVDFEAACERAETLGFSLILKHRELNAWLATCP